MPTCIESLAVRLATHGKSHDPCAQENCTRCELKRRYAETFLVFTIKLVMVNLYSRTTWLP